MLFLWSIPAQENLIPDAVAVAIERCSELFADM